MPNLSGLWKHPQFRNSHGDHPFEAASNSSCPETSRSYEAQILPSTTSNPSVHPSPTILLPMATTTALTKVTAAVDSAVGPLLPPTVFHNQAHWRYHHFSYRHPQCRVSSSNAANALAPLTPTVLLFLVRSAATHSTTRCTHQTDTTKDAAGQKGQASVLEQKERARRRSVSAACPFGLRVPRLRQPIDFSVAASERPSVTTIDRRQTYCNCRLEQIVPVAGVLPCPALLCRR